MSSSQYPNTPQTHSEALLYCHKVLGSQLQLFLQGSRPRICVRGIGQGLGSHSNPRGTACLEASGIRRSSFPSQQTNLVQEKIFSIFLFWNFFFLPGIPSPQNFLFKTSIFLFERYQLKWAENFPLIFLP